MEPMKTTLPTSSILSFPDRGPHGDADYRGNCSSHVVRVFLDLFRPRLFCDPAEGGRTSRDLAAELKSEGWDLDYLGLDLRDGFNLTRMPLLDRLPRRADYIFLHPAYWRMIPYSGPGGMWSPERAHPDDLSRLATYEGFLAHLKMQLLNVYEALERGGHYTVLIGDIRERGTYISVQADVLAIAPGALDSVLIKAQHYTRSGRCRYPGARFIPIGHEYLLTFRRDDTFFSLLPAALETSDRLARLSDASWRSVVETALTRLGGTAPLGQIYEAVEREAPDRVRSRRHWREKVRQVLQRFARPEGRGTWSLSRPEALAA